MATVTEFIGKSVDDAIQKASKALEISPDSLKYDVLSYGSSGIFGLVGAKKAKIRVTVKNGALGEVKSGEVKEERQGREKKEAPVEETADPGIEDERDETETEAGEKESQEPEPSEYETEEEIPEEAVAIGREALDKILHHINEEAQVVKVETNGRILFNVEGGNAAVMIGKRGQTLEAIQYIVEKVVNKRFEQRIRVQVDVEGYLKTRKENLEALAGRMAEKCMAAGKPITLGQMNAHDRRIVHLFLKEDARVRTQSKGDGFYRKLVIFPKKGGSKNRKSGGK